MPIAIKMTLRSRDREGYIESILDGKIPDDVSKDTATKFLKMLWDVERAINDVGRVRCHIELTEEK